MLRIICPPIVTYVIICVIVFLMYPKYSLATSNIIGNIFYIILLYYLCKKGYKNIAWALALIPVAFVVFYRKNFNKIVGLY